MDTLLKVREKRSSKHKSDEFISMFLYFLDIDLTNCLVYAHIYQKLYLVKGLKANLLVSNDILATKRVIIDIVNKTVQILSNQVTISITTQLTNQLVQKKVLIDRSLTIPPESKILVLFVYFGLSNN